ncbi:hypothetical protein IWQ60_011744 [Tieghemiomyces parasiticus]|uniref:Uncharacterized protein n=1 Tax=Tieghemiomyces parasiticus TaxID=78921 RepID=A0A9W7ZI25_9FUNG|nr:hypothetical protein IWQ60_011744 [Tieghemiomyces parasiticus]
MVKVHLPAILALLSFQYSGTIARNDRMVKLCRQHVDTSTANLLRVRNLKAEENYAFGQSVNRINLETALNKESMSEVSEEALKYRCAELVTCGKPMSFSIPKQSDTALYLQAAGDYEVDPEGKGYRTSVDGAHPLYGPMLLEWSLRPQTLLSALELHILSEDTKVKSHRQTEAIIRFASYLADWRQVFELVSWDRLNFDIQTEIYPLLSLVGNPKRPKLAKYIIESLLNGHLVKNYPVATNARNTSPVAACMEYQFDNGIPTSTLPSRVAGLLTDVAIIVALHSEVWGVLDVIGNANLSTDKPDDYFKLAACVLQEMNADMSRAPLDKYTSLVEFTKTTSEDSRICQEVRPRYRNGFVTLSEAGLLISMPNRNFETSPAPPSLPSAPHVVPGDDDLTAYLLEEDDDDFSAESGSDDDRSDFYGSDDDY